MEQYEDLGEIYSDLLRGLKRARRVFVAAYIYESNTYPVQVSKAALLDAIRDPDGSHRTVTFRRLVLSVNGDLYIG